MALDSSVPQVKFNIIIIFVMSIHSSVQILPKASFVVNVLTTMHATPIFTTEIYALLLMNHC